MFKEAINDLITVISGIADFDFVDRGELGKVNAIKKNGCLIMPDFKTPETFSGDIGEYSMQVPFTANCFIITSHHKSLKDAEDKCLDLAELVLAEVNNNERQVNMIGDNLKYFKWELTYNEWQERSASLCVLVLEFTVNLQV